MAASHEIMYPVTKLYTLFRTEMSNTIHCPAAHPPIGHIRESLSEALVGRGHFHA